MLSALGTAGLGGKAASFLGVISCLPKILASISSEMERVEREELFPCLSSVDRAAFNLSPFRTSKNSSIPKHIFLW